MIIDFIDVSKKTIPTNINKVLVGTIEVETRVLDLKKRLNIIQDESKENELSALEQYQKRMNKYIEFHRNEFEFVCPDCGQPTLLRRRC